MTTATITTMDPTTPMDDAAAADLLRLTQWLSPAFPVSGYAYSHGLETAMATGRVHDAATLSAWAGALIARGTGPLDVWAIRAVRGGAEAEAVAATLLARAGAPERWREALDQGAAFLAATAALGMEAAPPLPLAAALGLRARALRLPDATVCALYLQGLAGQIVGAAARFLPLGQSAAQAVLAGLHPAILATAARVDDAPPGTAAIAAEIDALRHATLPVRLFRS